MTFSIAARCARTGMLGIAVSSSSPAVAARCAYARAQVGAVGSQNITDPTLGPKLLDLMALGATAPEAVRIVAGSAAHITLSPAHCRRCSRTHRCVLRLLRHLGRTPRPKETAPPRPAIC